MERWPEDIAPPECEFYISRNNTLFASPITRAEQLLRRSGDRWVASFPIGPVVSAQARRLDALLARLRGITGLIQLWDFARPHPAGINTESGAEIEESRFADQSGFADGTVFSFGVVDGVVVYGDHARGASEVFTRGWTPSVVGMMREGDYVQLGRNLALLTADASTDALGRTRLQVEPALRLALVDGDAVIRTRAAAEMRLLDDDQSRRRIDVDKHYHYTLTFVEAL